LEAFVFGTVNENVRLPLVLVRPVIVSADWMLTWPMQAGEIPAT